MFLHVSHVKYVKGYTLQLTFNNGVVKLVDLQHELEGEVFEPLKQIDVFRRVTVNPDTKTIEWENGADFAPEFLDEIGQIKHVSEEKRIAYPVMQPVPA